MTFTFSPMVDSELGNTPRNANMVLAAIRQNNALGRVLKVDPQYMLLGVPNTLQLSLARRTLMSMGFASTEYDRAFNARSDMFCLRRGEMTVVVKSENSAAGRIGNIGNVGNVGFSLSDVPIVGGAADSADSLASAPGKLADVAVTAASAFAQNLTMAQKAALDTATFGFDLGVKVVLGSAIILSVAVLFPKIVDAMAGTYDRVEESRQKAREYRIVKTKQELGTPTGVPGSTGSMLGV